MNALPNDAGTVKKLRRLTTKIRKSSSAQVEDYRKQDDSELGEWNEDHTTFTPKTSLFSDSGMTDSAGKRQYHMFTPRGNGKFDYSLENEDSFTEDKRANSKQIQFRDRVGGEHNGNYYVRRFGQRPDGTYGEIEGKWSDTPDDIYEGTVPGDFQKPEKLDDWISQSPEDNGGVLTHKQYFGSQDMPVGGADDFQFVQTAEGPAVRITGKTASGRPVDAGKMILLSAIDNDPQYAELSASLESNGEYKKQRDKFLEDQVTIDQKQEEADRQAAAARNLAWEAVHPLASAIQDAFTDPKHGVGLNSALSTALGHFNAFSNRLLAGDMMGATSQVIYGSIANMESLGTGVNSLTNKVLESQNLSAKAYERIKNNTAKGAKIKGELEGVHRMSLNTMTKLNDILAGIYDEDQVADDDELRDTTGTKLGKPAYSALSQDERDKRRYSLTTNDLTVSGLQKYMERVAGQYAEVLDQGKEENLMLAINFDPSKDYTVDASGQQVLTAAGRQKLAKLKQAKEGEARIINEHMLGMAKVAKALGVEVPDMPRIYTSVLNPVKREADKLRKDNHARILCNELAQQSVLGVLLGGTGVKARAAQDKMRSEIGGEVYLDTSSLEKGPYGMLKATADQKVALENLARFNVTDIDSLPDSEKEAAISARHALMQIEAGELINKLRSAIYRSDLSEGDKHQCISDLSDAANEFREVHKFHNLGSKGHGGAYDDVSFSSISKVVAVAEKAGQEDIVTTTEAKAILDWARASGGAGMPSGDNISIAARDYIKRIQKAGRTGSYHAKGKIVSVEPRLWAADGSLSKEEKALLDHIQKQYESARAAETQLTGSTKEMFKTFQEKAFAQNSFYKKGKGWSRQTSDVAWDNAMKRGAELMFSTAPWEDADNKGTNLIAAIKAVSPSVLGTMSLPDQIIAVNKLSQAMGKGDFIVRNTRKEVYKTIFGMRADTDGLDKSLLNKNPSAKDINNQLTNIGKRYVLDGDPTALIDLHKGYGELISNTAAYGTPIDLVRLAGVVGAICKKYESDPDKNLHYTQTQKILDLQKEFMGVLTAMEIVPTEATSGMNWSLMKPAVKDWLMETYRDLFSDNEFLELCKRKAGQDPSDPSAFEAVEDAWAKTRDKILTALEAKLTDDEVGAMLVPTDKIVKVETPKTTGSGRSGGTTKPKGASKPISLFTCTHDGAEAGSPRTRWLNGLIGKVRNVVRSSAEETIRPKDMYATLTKDIATKADLDERMDLLNSFEEIITDCMDKDWFTTSKSGGEQISSLKEIVTIARSKMGELGKSFDPAMPAKVAEVNKLWSEISAGLMPEITKMLYVNRTHLWNNPDPAKKLNGRLFSDAISNKSTKSPQVFQFDMDSNGIAAIHASKGPTGGLVRQIVFKVAPHLNTGAQVKVTDGSGPSQDRFGGENGDDFGFSDEDQVQLVQSFVTMCQLASMMYLGEQVKDPANADAAACLKQLELGKNIVPVQIRVGVGEGYNYPGPINAFVTTGGKPSTGKELKGIADVLEPKDWFAVGWYEERKNAHELNPKVARTMTNQERAILDPDHPYNVCIAGRQLPDMTVDQAQSRHICRNNMSWLEKNTIRNSADRGALLQQETDIARMARNLFLAGEARDLVGQIVQFTNNLAKDPNASNFREFLTALGTLSEDGSSTGLINSLICASETKVTGTSVPELIEIERREHGDEAAEKVKTGFELFLKARNQLYKEIKGDSDAVVESPEEQYKTHEKANWYFIMSSVFKGLGDRKSECLTEEQQKQVEEAVAVWAARKSPKVRDELVDLLVGPNGLVQKQFQKAYVVSGSLRDWARDHVKYEINTQPGSELLSADALVKMVSQVHDDVRHATDDEDERRKVEEMINARSLLLMVTGSTNILGGVASQTLSQLERLKDSGEYGAKLMESYTAGDAEAAAEAAAEVTRLLKNYAQQQLEVANMIEMMNLEDRKPDQEERLRQQFCGPTGINVSKDSEAWGDFVDAIFNKGLGHTGNGDPGADKSALPGTEIPNGFGQSWRSSESSLALNNIGIRQACVEVGMQNESKNTLTLEAPTMDILTDEDKKSPKVLADAAEIATAFADGTVGNWVDRMQNKGEPLLKTALKEGEVLRDDECWVRIMRPGKDDFRFVAKIAKDRGGNVTDVMPVLDEENVLKTMETIYKHKRNFERPYEKFEKEGGTTIEYRPDLRVMLAALGRTALTGRYGTQYSIDQGMDEKQGVYNPVARTYTRNAACDDTHDTARIIVLPRRINDKLKGSGYALCVSDGDSAKTLQIPATLIDGCFPYLGDDGTITWAECDDEKHEKLETRATIFDGFLSNMAVRVQPEIEWGSTEDERKEKIRELQRTVQVGECKNLPEGAGGDKDVPDGQKDRLTNWESQIDDVTSHSLFAFKQGRGWFVKRYNALKLAAMEMTGGFEEEVKDGKAIAFKDMTEKQCRQVYQKMVALHKASLAIGNQELGIEGRRFAPDKYTLGDRYSLCTTLLNQRNAQFTAMELLGYQLADLDTTNWSGRMIWGYVFGEPGLKGGWE